MECEKLREIYLNFFQEKMKNNKEYHKLFNKAVDYQMNFIKKLSEEDLNIYEQIIDNYIEAEDKMLEETFICAVQYAYEVFKEIKQH